MIGKNHFYLYKKIPEYKLLNSSMTLEQFKTNLSGGNTIHRLIRGALLDYYILYHYFILHLKKLIKKNSLISLYLIFVPYN